MTQNVRTIRSVPLRLKGGEVAGVEVRGEAYLSRKASSASNTEREEADEARFANPPQCRRRHDRQLDPKIVARRKLDMFAYDALPGARKAFPNHWEIAGDGSKRSASW